ncbi:hypothetical protein CROQUDRAFT_715672 [Cronartium quercuum f. sp. fusiforme G11]|uniref:Conserved oligomeric Golgi complex subunit 3 n=1 Tax=Cronartium quercuum f. sp. fusiforme G11 TaxID=708437 RepID=A0A9P6TD44_9BASI|nr:hypothetical protein CROQUDRAFT_715672 [Cronartium quercuum f. sp. fusiforme G11]
MSNHRSQTQFQPQISSNQTRTENWDKLCPLNEIEKQSIQIIQKAVTDKPLPNSLSSALRTHHLNSLQNGTSITPNSTRSSSPTSGKIHPLLRIAKSSSRLDLLNPQSQLTRARSDSLHDQEGRASPQKQEDQVENDDLLDQIQIPVHTIEHFNDWFSHVSSMMDADSESDYLNHLSVISTYTSTCENLLSQIESCRGYLNEIQANWKFVDENSRSLERSCEGMLDDQKLLTHLNQALTERLNYFRRLEDAQRLLSMPGEAEIVKGDDFLPMVEQLDVCLEFMKSNRHYRDADLYLVRFQQCLTRSMTLIKLHFINSIRNLTHAVQEKLQGHDQSDSPTVRALVYAKFESVANELRPLISELEKRAKRDPEEYSALLSELFFTWVGVRTSVLSGRVRKEVERMEITNNQLPDVIKLATIGCNYLRNICGDEWRLFKAFFGDSGDDEVFSYLETLCDYLYDLLRPQILHESRLEVLCELATIVNSLIAIDSDLIDEETETEKDQPRQSNFKFSALLKPILQDVQTRLVFRAQAVIQSEVAGYQPRPEDLDYPKKLVARFESRPEKSKLFRQPTPEDSVQVEEALRFRLPPEEVQELWYPTLRRTLWVLSKLHTYVNDAIFEDFAGEAVGICSKSIVTASHHISSPSSSSSSNTVTLDSQLFAIRHLLILKKMIRTVDVLQIERAVDLGPLTDSLRELLTLRPSSLFRQLSKLGSGSSKTIDSKSELDKRLKETVANLINSSARMLIGPIENFMTRCQTFLATNSGSGVGERDLPSQEWARSDDVIELYKNYINTLKAKIGLILNKMILYLEDEKTINVIFPPLQAELMEIYGRFLNLIKSEYDPSTIGKIGSTDEVKTLVNSVVYSLSDSGTSFLGLEI